MKMKEEGRRGSSGREEEEGRREGEELGVYLGRSRNTAAMALAVVCQGFMKLRHHEAAASESSSSDIMKQQQRRR